MRGRLVRICCLAALTGSAFTGGVASATPGLRTFDQTYPVASALCARLASGKAGRRIEAQKPAATQACSQLMSSYSSAQAAVTAANSAFQQAREGAISARDGACSQAYASHEYAACRAARLAFRATIVSLRANRRTTLAQFPPSVESARMTFWQTITALRNG